MMMRWVSKHSSLLLDRSGRVKSLARDHHRLTVNAVPKSLIMIGNVNGYWPGKELIETKIKLFVV